MWTASGWLVFFKKQWNLLLTPGIILFFSISRITVPPALGPDEILGGHQYENTARIITILVLALCLLPCYKFRAKKNGRWWWLASLIFLVVGVLSNYFYQKLNTQYTIHDKEFGYGVLVK